MNVVNKIFNIKKKKIKPLHDVNLHFVEKINSLNVDKSYHKTINILRKQIFIILYFKYLNISIGKILIRNPTDIKSVCIFIQKFLDKNTFLLSDLKKYNLFAFKKNNNIITNMTKIDKNSNKHITELALKYNEYKSYQSIDSKHRLPFILNIIIEPLYLQKNLYINYKNNIVLCKLQECFICYEIKYLKNICPNKHYICFNCINKLKKYKKNKCPYCITPINL